MAADESSPALRVTVAFSPRAGCVDEVSLVLEPGATVGDALQASGMAARHPNASTAEQAVGVWGKRCESDARLRDHDRVEIYRPLLADPKDARRQRQRVQRADLAERKA